MYYNRILLLLVISIVLLALPIQAALPDIATPTYPVNNSVLSRTYPPFVTSVPFLWDIADTVGSHIIIARDSSFNDLVYGADKYLPPNSGYTYNSFIASLEAGDYYWKVQAYDSVTTLTGDYSDTFHFQIATTLPSFGTGVQGIIYELSGTTKIPIPGVTVIVSNATFTASRITGSGGYYMVSGLSSGVYSVKAYRQDMYIDSIEYPVSIITNSTFTQDIPLQQCVSGFNCYYNRQYVQFIITDYVMYIRYAGVTVSVYTGLSTVPILTGITGTDGGVTFLLIKDTQYTITAKNTTLGIDKSITITPQGNTANYIRMDLIPYTWHTGTGGYDVNEQVHTSVSSVVINATHAYINVSYNDSLAQTSGLIFTLNTSIPSDPLNQTTIQTSSSGSSSTYNHSFIVSGYTCINYFVNIRATHTTFGSLNYPYGITFPGMCNAAGLNSTLLYYFGIALLIFIGGMAGATSSTQVGGVVVFMGWVLQGFGWISGVNTSVGLTAGLTMATIFIAVSMMNDRAKNEGVA